MITREQRLQPSLDNKILRKKKLDKELTVKVIKNEASERIFVEFTSKDGKMILHRSFQDTYYGREDAKAFENSFKSIDEFEAYFARRNNVTK
jgi:hypothetical protein